MQNDITLAIKNCQLVLENGILWDAVVLISNDKIAAFGSAIDTDIPTGVKTIDAEGKYLGPGLVDIHVHGGGGYLTTTNLIEAGEFFLKHGATTILATPWYSLDFETHLDAIKNIKRDMPKAKNVRGIYMEGPYTNPNYGANKNLNPWRHGIVESEYKAIVDAAGDLVKVWTIAPELENIVTFIEYVKAVNPNAVLAIGHSEATPEQIRQLGKYRPTLQTHSMNATGRLPVPGGTRGRGPDEYCLANDDVYCELISDSCGMHVHSDMQRFLLHCKGVDKVVLISDSTNYNNPSPAGCEHITDLNFDPWGRLAGSKLTMDAACRNIMSHTRAGIVEAFIMASRNPARVIGLGDEIGTVEVGKYADLVLVDDRFNVDKVILRGEICEF